MDDDEDNTLIFEPQEKIPWSLSYILICILLPSLAGAINGFAWPVYSLYVRKMGWDLALGGMGITIGSLARGVTQQVILRVGIWTCVCFAALQTTAAILALIFTDQAVVIGCQAGAVLTFDVTVAVEGIVFDNFADSEAMVSQAQSTVLSAFTIALALSATAGSAIYDLFDWKGVSVFHMCLAGGQLVLMAFQPALRQSFRTFLRGAKDAEESEDEDIGVLPDQVTSIVPAPAADTANTKSKAVQPPMEIAALLPGAVEDGEEIQADAVPLTVTAVEGSRVPVAEKVEEIKAADHDGGQPGEDPAASTKHATPKPEISMYSMYSSGNPRGSMVSNASKASNPAKAMVSDVSRASNPSKAMVSDASRASNPSKAMVSDASRASNRSRASKASGTGHSQHGLISPNLARSSAFRGRCHSSCRSGASHRVSQHSGGSVDGHKRISQQTNKSGGTAGSADIARRLLSPPSGEHCQYNFGITNSLRPSIASAKVRMAVECDGDSIGERIDAAEVLPRAGEQGSPREQGLPNMSEKSQKSTGLSRDMYLVAFLIAMCSFNNNASYAIEWATFGIFFKEQHGWTSATWAGIFQTAGDLFAAFMMKICGGGERPELSEMSGIRWFFYSVASQPYNLVLLTLGWIIMNAGLCVPVLPVAIVSQVIMGTVYVYSMKAITDINLFYSLGDTKVFLQLQVQCRNADTLGNMLSGYFTLALYEMNPVYPFVFATALSTITCITVMLGFCSRLGFGLDIETAEARRSRKRGMTRKSQWKIEGMKSISDDG